MSVDLISITDPTPATSVICGNSDLISHILQFLPHIHERPSRQTGANQPVRTSVLCQVNTMWNKAINPFRGAVTLPSHLQAPSLNLSRDDRERNYNMLLTAQFGEQQLEKAEEAGSLKTSQHLTIGWTPFPLRGLALYLRQFHSLSSLDWGASIDIPALDISLVNKAWSRFLLLNTLANNQATLTELTLRRYSSEIVFAPTLPPLPLLRKLTIVDVAARELMHNFVESKWDGLIEQQVNQLVQLEEVDITTSSFVDLDHFTNLLQQVQKFKVRDSVGTRERERERERERWGIDFLLSFFFFS